MLKGEWVDIDQTRVISDSSLDKVLMSMRWWVDVGMSKWLLNNFSRVDVLESCDFLSNVIVVNLGHFPTEHNIDSSLVAFIKSDFVGVSESEDFLVWSPVLDSGTGSGSSLELVLSHETLIIKSPEVGSFPLIWSLWCVTDHISISVVPSVVVVLVHGVLAVHHVHENVLRLMGGSHLWESFDVGVAVVEAWSDDEGLVSVFLSIGEGYLVLAWVILSDFNADISSGPWLNLTGDGSRLELEWWNMTMCATEVGSRHAELSLLGDEGHLPVWRVGLDKLGQSC